MLKKYLYCIEVLVSIKAVFLMPHLYTLYYIGVWPFLGKIADCIIVFPAAYYAIRGKKIALIAVAIYLLAMYASDFYSNVYTGSLPPFLKIYRVLLALYFFTGAGLMLREGFSKRDH